MSGVIYVFGEGDPKNATPGDSWVKVGKTCRDHRDRLQAAQTWNPRLQPWYSVTLGGEHFVESEAESDIHRELSDLRVFREWFRWEPARMSSALTSTCEKYDGVVTQHESLTSITTAPAGVIAHFEPTPDSGEALKLRAEARQQKLQRAVAIERARQGEREKLKTELERMEARVEKYRQKTESATQETQRLYDTLGSLQQVLQALGTLTVRDDHLDTVQRLLRRRSNRVFEDVDDRLRRP